MDIDTATLRYAKACQEFGVDLDGAVAMMKVAGGLTQTGNRTGKAADVFPMLALSTLSLISTAEANGVDSFIEKLRNAWSVQQQDKEQSSHKRMYEESLCACTFSRFGYHNIITMNDGERQESLKKAVAASSPDIVQERLFWLANINTSSAQPLFEKDCGFVTTTYGLKPYVDDRQSRKPKPKPQQTKPTVEIDIDILKDGRKLGTFGYANVKRLSDEERQQALDRAVTAYGPQFVKRKLFSLAGVTKCEQFQQDFEWITVNRPVA